MKKIIIFITIIYTYSVCNIEEYEKEFGKISKQINKALKYNNLIELKKLINKKNINKLFIVPNKEEAPANVKKYKLKKLIDDDRILAFEATTLSIASIYGCNQEIINYLISLKPDINIRDSARNSAIMYACKQNQENIVKLLILNKANPNFKDLQNEDTALIIASRKGYTKIVELLIETKNININATNLLDQTALNVSVNREISKLLIDAGAIDTKPDLTAYLGIIDKIYSKKIILRNIRTTHPKI